MYQSLPRNIWRISRHLKESSVSVTSKSKPKKLKIQAFRELGLLIVLFLMCLVISIASPYFLKPLNLFNVLRQFSVVGILAIGQTIVLVAAGIDLSVGSIVSMAGCAAAWVLARDVNPWLAVVMGILSGTIAGFVNGLVVTKFKINAFIATLGMLSIAQGAALLISGGLPLTFRGPFKVIGQGYVWQIPVPVILMFMIGLLGVFFMKRSVLARKIYAVGGSERAALVSGIKIDWIRIFVFTLNGTLAGLAGIIVGSNLAVADPTVATGLELDVIAAAVIGGASLSGGEGTVWGALLGAAVMGVLRNAFVLLNISGYWQVVVIGLFVILAVAFDNLTAKK